VAIITGGAGDDILNGGAEDDTIDGQAGNDELHGGAGLDSLFGGAGNDYLDGGTGADIMAGGVGDYVVDNALDSVVEAAGEGSDRVFSSVDYTLTGNVENLTLISGSAAVIGIGNAERNEIFGNESNNIIFGGDGFDFLHGGAGADTMTGGQGSDNYFVDSLLDTVIEAPGEGYDTINSEIDYTVVVSNTERLVLLAGSAAVSGTGDAQNNDIVGNENNNILSGLDGNDKIDGGDGDDTIMGGAGEDILDGLAGNDNMQGGDAHDVLEGGDGNDLMDGGAGEDILVGGAGADTLIGSAGYDTYTYFDLGFGIDTIQDTAAVVGEGNRIFFNTPSIVGGSLTFTEDQVARTLTIQVGSSGTDKIILANFDKTGANGSLVVQHLLFFDGTVVNLLDLLNALPSGIPTEGDDILTGTPFSDVINALGGNDVVNALSGNDFIDGGAGADTLLGGAGDDIYGVDQAGDLVTEQANDGIDLVQSSASYTLGANVENLTLTGIGAIDGTGNELTNVLTGNSAANVLTGGAGTDTLLGGAGDDTYGVDQAGDLVTEQANDGIDLVQSSASYTLGANLEILMLTGTDAIDGTGNSLNNILTGNSAVNVLTGEAGSDTYVVGAGDTVVEVANEGTDLVQSSVSWTLGANIERLTLTGTGTIDGTGNSLSNVLTGISAANVLTGGAGNDTLAGDLGNDTYRINRGEGQDTISENDGTIGNSDSLLYGATINPLDLVLSRQVNDLRIAIHGSTDQVTVQNWYSAPTTAQVETIQAGNGQTLLSTQVDQLIQAMASFSQQTGLTWDQALDQRPQDVQLVVAPSWQ